MGTVLSIMVLAAIALLGGALWLWRNGGSQRQIALMLLLAVIIAGNVAIWVLPGADGNAPMGTELH